MKYIKNALIASAVIISNEVYAQGSSEWVKPATSLIEDLEGGLVEIGALIIGIGIVAVGIWGAFSGRMDWGKVASVVIAGLIITAGPAAIRLLLGSGA